MASAIVAANPQPLSTTSHSRQNHMNPSMSFSAAFDPALQDSHPNPNMSFSMSQGSQGGGMVMQPNSSFRQYDGSNGHSSSNSAPQIYSAVYSGVDVYEMEVNGVAVMRRRKDSWLNATQILKVAGIEKGKRTKVLEKEILIGDHEKVQGGYGKYQGTWIKFERGLEFCRQYGVEEVLRPLLTYDMGQDGGIAGRGGMDTPTKEQAMAAQRKRLYNSSAENRNSAQSGTFFKNISSTASHAVAAISKARFDSPGPRMRNGSSRPASFSRQSSQQQIGSQESVFPGGSQQSMQSFVSAEGLPDSAYSTQLSQQQNGEFEEPPRKRIRPSPSVHDSQPMNDGYYDMSMREPSPTEANDSFVYHQTDAEDLDMPMGPLPSPSTPNELSKKALLMSLFTNPLRSDFRSHEVFTALKPEDLDMPIDNTANTALIWAATLSRIPLLKQLIAKGASIYRVNKAGETALMRSCVVTNNLDMGSFPDLLELLGPTLDFRDARGRTVLHHIAITSAVKGRSQASKYYLESLLEFVVRQGPNSQQSFSNGMPGKSFNIGRFMSEIINVQDRSGDTALNIASRIGNRSIISQLMEVGADPSLPNRSNLNAQDFGVGGPPDTTGRLEEHRPKTVSRDAKESSGEIITSITALLTETEAEFTQEINAKQASIDKIHFELRDRSRELGEQRRRLEATQAEAKVRDIRKMKIVNLMPAIETERSRLSQLQQQFGQANSNIKMSLGDADEGLTLPAGSNAANILATTNPSQPGNEQDLHVLAASIPQTHVIRARLNAYRSNNAQIEDGVRGLQSKSSQLAAKYRYIISLCTGTDEKKVDTVLDNLLRAVESENDVELARVREFLHRVGDVE